MARRRTTNSHSSRTDAERARLYVARTAWHKDQIHRRVRDNTIAGVLGGLLVVGAIASQSVHATVTTPEPKPTVPTTIENPFTDLFVGDVPAE